ncbi:MAG: T9SS type A sorting domain-containing protein [Saprospiraceae bacterium]|nr:T9SS type A sorting domain-containing protein [Saprospiraceae bacterium]
MKPIFLLLIILTCSALLNSQTILLNDDFESYSQGPISSQNSGWTDLSNATADVTWAGGAFSACSSSDVNQAYLSFISGDNIEAGVGLNAVNGQISVEMNVSIGSGFEIKFFSADIFYQDHYDDVQTGFNLKYIIDFEANVVNKFENGSFVNTSPIQSNFNSLENIVFSNSFGNFKLGCISVTDVTDLDNDGYYANEDCNDTNPDVNPGATEIPYDGIDNDCNPNTQDDDVDGDGYVMANDCNDNNAGINPGMAEIIYNGLDDDCNPSTIDDDLDADGYILANDCNDNNANINPGATEITYNGIDEDCNPITKDDDLDADGYVLANDCNDNDPHINPGESEIAYNGIDDDCNPFTPDDDLDGDGFILANDCDDKIAGINPGQTEITYNGFDDDCNPFTLDDDLDGDGHKIADDCDDNNASINPGEIEIAYNGIDDDCNPFTPDDDLDEDGYTVADDCDDNNSDVNPNVDEVPGNGIDDNCNGQIDEITDTNDILQKHVAVSPNPSFDYITIKSPFEIKKVELYTATGIKVTTYYDRVIDISIQPSGAYYLTISIENSDTVVRRIIIQR